MTTWRQLLGLTCLVGYVAVWWLAVRIVFRGWFGVFTWVPVAVAAFGIPMMAADLMATSHWRSAEAYLLAGWAALPLAIDSAWLIVRRLRRRGSGVGPTAAFYEAADVKLD